MVSAGTVVVASGNLVDEGDVKVGVAVVGRRKEFL